MKDLLLYVDTLVLFLPSLRTPKLKDTGVVTAHNMKSQLRDTEEIL